MLECRLCEQNQPLFPSLDDLEAHLASEHFDCLPYECESCHFAKFPTEFAVMKHCEKDHGFKFYSFRCRITPDVLVKRQKVRVALMKNSVDPPVGPIVSVLTNAAEVNSSTSSQRTSATPEQKGAPTLDDGLAPNAKLSSDQMKIVGVHNITNQQRSNKQQQQQLQRGVATQNKKFQYDVFAAHAAVLSLRPQHQSQLVAQKRQNQMNNTQNVEEDSGVTTEVTAVVSNDETAILNGKQDATLHTGNNFNANMFTVTADDFEDDDGGMPIQLDLGATPTEALHAACDENIRRFSNRIQVKIETDDRVESGEQVFGEHTSTTLFHQSGLTTTEGLQCDELCDDIEDGNEIGNSAGAHEDIGQDVEDEQFGPTTDWLNIFSNGKLNLKNNSGEEEVEYGSGDQMLEASLAEHSGGDGEEMSMTGSGSRIGSENAEHRYSLRPARPNRYRPYDPINIDRNSDKKRQVERIKCKKCGEMVNITGGCLMHHVNTRHLKLPLFHCTTCKKDFLEVSNTAIHKHMRLAHNGDTTSMQSNYHAHSAQLHAARDECFGKKEERTYLRRMSKSQTSLSPTSIPKSSLLDRSPSSSARPQLKSTQAPVPPIKSPVIYSSKPVFLSQQPQRLTPLQQHLLSSSANPTASWPILNSSVSKPSMSYCNNVKQEHPQLLPHLQQQQQSNFANSSNLCNNSGNNNILVAPEQEKVVCRQCGDQVWNKVSNRLNHVNVKHLHIPLYQCRICQKQFQSFSRSACYSHVNFVHKAELDAGIAGSIDDNIINLKEEYMLQLQEVSTDYF